MLFVDSETRFPVADSEIYPIHKALELLLVPPNPPLPQIISEKLESMILSVSGWRKIFADDGSEESFSTHITPADTVISGIIAAAFADHMIASLPDKDSLTILIGIDTRPTGPTRLSPSPSSLPTLRFRYHPIPPLPGLRR